VARVLACVPGVPHRSRGASTVLFFHYIEQLLRAGHEVLCLLLSESAFNDDEVAELRALLRQAGRASVSTAVVPAFLRFAKYSGAGIPGRLPADAQNAARDFDAHAVLYFDLGCLATARSLGEEKRTLAWLGDLAFESIWHHSLYDAREDRFGILRLPKLWLVCRRWRNAYRRFLRGVDFVIVSSGSSEATVRSLGAAAVRYFPYPWPIGKPFRSAAAHRAASDKPRFLFCGTLSGLGSRSAMHYLLDRLYPELVRGWGAGAFEIVITGTRALPAWAMQSLRAKPEIRFEGFVEDLYACMDQCHAAIVPIDVPVGNRSRIVTAMGYGLLVIAHPNTARGNPALVSGDTCLLASTPEEFARCMKLAYEDRELSMRIERSARQAYERLFAPEPASRLLIGALEAA
jgi:glycosyltransferase involved in cell wall biosynthesis